VRKSFSFAVVCRVLANLSAVATAFLSIRLYSLYVTKDIYGAIGVGLQIISYLPMMNGGFRMVLNQQMLAESDGEKTARIARFGQTLQSYFFIFVGVGGALLMALYSQSPHTRATGIPLAVFLTAGFAAAIGFQSGGQLALLVAFGEQAASSLIQGGSGLASLLILWISFAAGLGVWAFPISGGLSALITIAGVRLVLRATHHHVPLFVWRREPDFWPRFRAIWRSGFYCLYNNVLTYGLFSIDLILVGVLLGPGPAALYLVVTRVTTISRQLLQSLSEAAWPRLTAEVDSRRRAEMMRKVDRLNAWLVGAWFGTLIVTLLPALTVLVKADWLASPMLAAIIIARNWLIAVASPHAYGLLSAARFRDLAVVNQQDVIVGVVAGLALGWPFGVTGLAGGFLLGTISANSWRMTFLYFRFAHDTHWLRELVAVYARTAASGIVSIALAWACWNVAQSHLGGSGWLALPVSAIAFLVPIGAVAARWRLTGRIP
jgi:O-antigen/teichoic acid export membrane protein